jgi:hypothetical protein
MGTDAGTAVVSVLPAGDSPANAHLVGAPIGGDDAAAWEGVTFVQAPPPANNGCPTTGVEAAAIAASAARPLLFPLTPPTVSAPGGAVTVNAANADLRGAPLAGDANQAWDGATFTVAAPPKNGGLPTTGAEAAALARRG